MNEVTNQDMLERFNLMTYFETDNFIKFTETVSSFHNHHCQFVRTSNADFKDNIQTHIHICIYKYAYITTFKWSILKF